MPPEKSSTVDFLNEIAKAEPFKEEIVTEEPEEKEEPEKALPFHKDPKVQRYVEKQIEKALKDVRPSAERQFKDDVKDITLPESFIKIVGNDTEEKRQALKDMSDYLAKLPEKAKEQFLEEQRQEAKKIADADTAAQEELDTYFEEIEENYDVDLSSNSASAKKTRSEFIDYVRKIAPKNDEGEVTAFPDLIAAFEEFQEKGKRPVTASRAKELASRGLTRSTDSSTATPTGRSWKDVDRYFSKLTNSN